MIPALAFLNPWLLAALATLPLIYWLLRTVPPRPRRIEFPPTRILVDIENREKTPAKTPWWLLLIRLLAAALVIIALAEPVLNPNRGTVLEGDGPVAILIDNGWSSGSEWGERVALARRLIDEAEGQSRAVVVLGTAAATKAHVVRIEAPSEARSALAALAPQPFAPDRLQAVEALGAELKGAAGSPSLVWLSDGIDHDGGSDRAMKAMSDLTREGTFTVVSMALGSEPLGVVASVAGDGKLEAAIVRAEGAPRDGAAHALSAKGQRLGEAAFHLGAGQTRAAVTFELPLELRNQVTRVEIAGERSAGAVSLLDKRSQWQRVGLISGESVEQAQPLLAPLYYVQRAVQPFAEIIRPKERNLTLGVDKVLSENASVMVLADIGTLDADLADRVRSWVEKGGVLIRFAGPHLEKGGDDLVPMPLRAGGRTLGGALSWSTPQRLSPFDDGSVFAGLTVPTDVTISRQVLADPAALTPDVKVWARLEDGTPLVTARRQGEGHIVLVHVTANSDWSNLPLSGLFVEMLKRITQLGTLTTASAGAEAETGASGAEATAETDLLPPVTTLDGQGDLKPPPPTAEPIRQAESESIVASLSHPPGYYGAGGTPRAINVLKADADLKALPPLPSGARRAGAETETAAALKPWLLTAAVALIFADILAVIALMGGLSMGSRGRRQAGAAVLALALLAPALYDRAAAQGRAPHDPLIFDEEPPEPPARFIFPGQSFDAPKPVTVPATIDPKDQIPIQATSEVTFAYVKTGNPSVDEVSRAGLAGLVRVLKQRTAVEPGPSMGVDIMNDEIVFYPVLYWPVLDNPEPLPSETLSKIDAYMKQGGMIIFDTRDYGQGLPTGMSMAGERGPALQRLIGRLDLPPLEPVPADHVLTRSFYLLQAFPGRWDGGQLWVEAQDADEGGSNQEAERRARRADGVSSILITPNDLASAWALDEAGRALFPVVPGGERQRELAFRSGINIVMHALTGNYKADQVHVPALLERLGQ